MRCLPIRQHQGPRPLQASRPPRPQNSPWVRRTPTPMHFIPMPLTIITIRALRYGLPPLRVLPVLHLSLLRPRLRNTTVPAIHLAISPPEHPSARHCRHLWSPAMRGWLLRQTAAPILTRIPIILITIRPVLHLTSLWPGIQRVSPRSTPPRSPLQGLQHPPQLDPHHRYPTYSVTMGGWLSSCLLPTQTPSRSEVSVCVLTSVAFHILKGSGFL